MVLDTVREPGAVSAHPPRTVLKFRDRAAVDPTNTQLLYRDVTTGGPCGVGYIPFFLNPFVPSPPADVFDDLYGTRELVTHAGQRVEHTRGCVRVYSLYIYKMWSNRRGEMRVCAYDGRR